MHDVAAPADYELYWGDLHKHLTGPGTRLGDIGTKLRGAREHLDFCAAYCYPFTHYQQGSGLTVETTGGRPEFQDWWDEIQERSREHNDPGAFVTFPAYEWHGNRRRWGDHHVVYFEEGSPLDDTADVRDLYANLAERRAFLVPHHTGYRVGDRGKDWDAFDPDLSPVMEVYSTHGSSEGVGTPVAMEFNHSMGPRTSGGTFHDALERDIRVGVVASNDGPGVPGAWNRGVAGVWATELTREGLWEAIEARRTYGSTGDRIALWWSLDDAPMGSVAEGGGAREASVAVDCPRPLDRVEVLRNGRVAETYTHRDRAFPRDLPGVYRILVEFGWGPTKDYGGFDDTDVRWDGEARVEGGALRDVAPRFVGEGQSYAVAGDRCEFSLLTSRDEPPAELPEAVSRSYRQGLILEVEGDAGTELSIDLEDRETLSVSLADATARARLFPFRGEAAALIEEAFGIPEDELGNLDRLHHTAPKVKVHRAAPLSACRADVTVDLDVDAGDCVYVRASQVDGQYAWASPVWIEN